jgi:16S rRNA (cytosine1407-C5)-methyltransferase
MRSEAGVLPQEFLHRLQRLFPSSRWDRVVNTFTEPKPTTFRVNTLKADSDRLRERLEAEGFRLEPVGWYRSAFILRGGRLRELQQTPAYQHGELYVQSLSSMVPPLALDPRPGERLLDVAAAPGGKTTQLACLMEGRGAIVANDNNRIRFYKLRANVLQQGAPNVKLSLRFGETFGKSDPEAFDRVLVDAPCSTEGRFFTREPASYRQWKLRKIHEMAGKQRRLLRSAADALKPGGILVYSTCTFAPEENEAVVDWLLGEQAGRGLALEPVSLAFPNTMPGLTRWEDRAFHPALSRAIRIIPTGDMEGFFLARLRKRSRERA